MKRKKNIKLQNLGNCKYVSFVEGGQKRVVSISEYTRWDGFPMIQAFEDGMPYSTLSLSVISSEKGISSFYVDLQDVNVKLVRALVAQGILSLSGMVAEIKWPESPRVVKL